MRYVNRHRLLIVVVLAALFGAVLPYLELLLPRDRLEHPIYIDRKFRGFVNSDWKFDRVLLVNLSVDWAEDKEDLFRSLTHGLFQVEPLEHHSYWYVVRVGWPFRVLYGVRRVVDSKDITMGPAWIRLPDWARRVGFDNNLATDSPANFEFPTGIIWKALMGNIAAMIALFGSGYIGLSCWRAKRRIKHGKCWRCGYLSHGAAVCPECGGRWL